MSIQSKLKKVYESIAPGLFVVGYIIGTGSVTSMIIAGARYGMSLTWALLLSCGFSWVMLISIDRLTIVTGNTIIFNIREYMGRPLAVLIIMGLMVTVISSISGVMGIVVEVTQETFLSLGMSKGNAILIASIFLLFLLVIFFSGKHQIILKFMALMVALMGINFVLTNFLIVQEPKAILSGLVPSIPEGKPHLIIAGIVGTTMAAVVFVSRSSLVAESKWTIEKLKKENRDALVAVCLTFFISAAIMASAAGTLYVKGIMVENAIEMVQALQPLVGAFAIFILLFGIISAGLSSIFPNMVLLPWLISDISHRERNLKSRTNRILVLLVCSTGLFIPIFGGKPVAIMVASQAFSPLMMPLLVISLLMMLNSKKVMGERTISKSFNFLLIVTLGFSLYMLVIAAEGYLGYFTKT